MSEIVPTESAKISRERDSLVEEFTGKSIRIRVAPNSYLIALFLTTFFTGLLIYLELDIAALALLAVGWIMVPIFLWTDRIAFDGKKLSRLGLLPRAWGWINGSDMSLSLDEIEQVDLVFIPIHLLFH